MSDKLSCVDPDGGDLAILLIKIAEVAAVSRWECSQPGGEKASAVTCSPLKVSESACAAEFDENTRAEVPRYRQGHRIPA